MKIAVFGYSISIEEVMEEKEFDIIVYLDNDPKKWGTSKKGIKILNPEKIQDYIYDYILITSIKESEIKTQLTKLGVDIKKITSLYDIDKDVIEIEPFKRYSKKVYDKMCNILEERPFDINIETINYCPLKCVFCPNKKIKRDRKIMDMNLFDKICNNYTKIGGGALGINSMQSDVFSDPLFDKRLSCLEKYTKDLYIYTTTSLINMAKFDDLIVEKFLHVFNYIQISLGGANEKDYKEMYGVDGFNVFMKQIDRIKNIIEINNFNTKIDLYFRTKDSNKLKEEETYNQLVDIFNVAEVRDTFFSWYGMILPEELPSGAKIIYKNNDLEDTDCVVPNVTLSITSNGEVTGCGCIDWETKYIIGDININKIEEIWKSERAVSFKQAFTSGNLPEICKECGLYLSKNILGNKSLENYDLKKGIYYNNL